MEHYFNAYCCKFRKSMGYVFLIFEKSIVICWINFRLYVELGLKVNEGEKISRYAVA